MTKQEIESRIQVAAAKMVAAYDERDRYVAEGNEAKARDWDMKASELDLACEKLLDML
jgi:hypothetical protein